MDSMFKDSEYNNGASAQAQNGESAPERQRMDRRGFLASALASAGVFALSACGGGSGGSDSTAAGASAAVRGVANAAITVSPNGTTIPSATKIIDSAAARWTVSNGVVYRNGAKAGYTSQVTLLLWYNTAIYQRNAAGNWWKWTNTTWSPIAKDPRYNLHFYGLCDHQYYAPNDPATIKAQLISLGVKAVRNGATSTAGIDSLLANVVTPYAPQIAVYPMINPWPGDAGATTEAAAYAYGRTMGAYAAQKLGRGVCPYIEIGNEWDCNFNVAGDGLSITDYTVAADGGDGNAAFALYRGAIRGFIAGFESIDPTHITKLVIGGSGWLHLGFLDGIWNGKAPDGTTGHPTARGDYVAWHWYCDMGNIVAANGGTVSNYNLLQQLQTRFSKPILLTEVGCQMNESEATVQAYMVTFYDQIRSLAAQYSILNVTWYSRTDDSQTCGLYLSDGVTAKPRLATLTNYIAANPMP
jgi:Glycosyl hydrolase catalytic core